MKRILTLGNFLKLALVMVVAQLFGPVEWKPSYLVTMPFYRTKPLQTVTLQQALDRAEGTGDKPTIAVLYLTIIPADMKQQLAEGVQRWTKAGAAVHAFSIDAVGEKGSVPRFASTLGKDIAPVWIRMPEGEACALEQLAAVNAFTKLGIDPNSEIPLLAFVLRDTSGKVRGRHTVVVPNGEAFDPAILERAIDPFDFAVRRVLK